MLPKGQNKKNIPQENITQNKFHISLILQKDKKIKKSPVDVTFNETHLGSTLSIAGTWEAGH